MKTFVKLLIILFIGSFWSSCDQDEFLKEENPGGLTAENHYTDAEGMESAYVGAYRSLRNIYGGGFSAPGYGTDVQGHQRSLYVWGTDIFMRGVIGMAGQAGGGVNKVFAENWNEYRDYQPDAPQISVLWNRLYDAIQEVNVFLNRGEEIDFPDKAAKRAEARFMRAYMYYMLTEQCGGVSIVTEEINEPVATFPRESESDMYDFIISELEIALEDIHADPGEGRISEGAVRHMLALAHLTRGYRDYGTDNDFSIAAGYADDVIGDGNYRLLENFEDINDYDNQLNDEIIFAIQYHPQSRERDGSAHNQSGDFGFGITGYSGFRSHTYYHNKSSRLMPTPYLYQLFNSQNDSRYNATFKHKYYADESIGNIEEGDLIFEFAPVDQPYTQVQIDSIKNEEPNAEVLNYEDWAFEDEGRNQLYPMIWKFYQPNWQLMASQPMDETDIVVFRLGGTYLLAAEAYLMAGDEGTAIDRFNTLRERAATDGNEAEMTVDQLDLDMVIDEWARERCGSYKRWFTLKRTEKLMERAEAYNKRIVDEGISLDNPAIRYRPVPISVINTTENEYPQNDSW